MQDPKSQVDMFEDDRNDAILGNMMMLDEAQEETPEEETAQEDKEKK